MSKSYDLEIIKAVRKILVDDNTDPNASNNEYCIHHFVEDRIYLGEIPLSNIELPHITLTLDSGPGDSDLPAEHGELRVKIWYEQVSHQSRTDCRRCAARVSGLLNQQPERINAANSSITVRLCDKASHDILIDPDVKAYYGSLVFDITFKRVIGE